MRIKWLCYWKIFYDTYKIKNYNITLIRMISKVLWACYILCSNVFFLVINILYKWWNAYQRLINDRIIKTLQPSLFFLLLYAKYLYLHKYRHTEWQDLRKIVITIKLLLHHSCTAICYLVFNTKMLRYQYHRTWLFYLFIYALYILY